MSENSVGIITFHFVCNCGAVLQCQALSAVLTKMGYKVQVIDYRPDYHWSQYAVKASLIHEFLAIRVKYGDRRLKDRLHAYYAIPVWIKKNSARERRFRADRLAKFWGYIENYLPLTEKCIDEADLKKVASRFQYFICGSDQIWNRQITNGKFDPAYFLNFVSEGKKIAYAASCGVYPEDGYKEQFKNYLKGLNAVSVRERSIADRIEQDFDIRTSVVLDPALLLEAGEWVQYEDACDNTERPYILVYCLEPTEQFEKTVQFVQMTLEIEIINITPNDTIFSNERSHIKTCAPGEFLYLIHHAEYVVTNSFHATVFSLLYHKRFSCVTHSKTGGRMEDLLKSVGLEDHIVRDGAFTKIVNETAYTIVDKVLDEKRKQSVEYLKNNLQ